MVALCSERRAALSIGCRYRLDIIWFVYSHLAIIMPAPSRTEMKYFECFLGHAWYKCIHKFGLSAKACEPGRRAKTCHHQTQCNTVLHEELLEEPAV